MYLVKASAQVLAIVHSKHRQLFRFEPRDWQAGEAVLFTRNKGDLQAGEKPISVSARLVKVRPLEGEETTELASGAGGQFKFVAEYEAVSEIEAPFDLDEALGEEAAGAYKRVTIARKFEKDDAASLDAFLAARAPARIATATAEAPAEQTPPSAAPDAAVASATLTDSVQPSPTPPESTASTATAAQATAEETAPSPAASASETAPTVAAPRSETARPTDPEPEGAQANSGTPGTAAEAQQVQPAYLPWYLEPIEMSRLTLAFFTAGAFLLGAVAF